MEILIFLIILSVLILVHELGHFLVARKFGIKVEEFGFGYPPRIWGKKIGETIYSINLLPFGGFVRMLGEDSGEQVKNQKNLTKAFFKQSKLKRSLVLIAGVTMNFLLGVVLFGAIFTHLGVPEPVSYLTVTGIAEDSPAFVSDLKSGDRIVAVEGLAWPEDNSQVSEQFILFINDHRGETIKLNLDNGAIIEIVPRLKEDIPEGQGALGVAITGVDAVQHPMPQRAIRGVWYGLKEATAWGKDILKAVTTTIWGLFKGQTPEGVAGPVGIYEISKDVAATGLIATLQFMAILSVNLAILNLLPLPALDGGRLLFIIIESVTRRRVKPELEQAVHLIGMAILIGLMILITIVDVKRLAG